MSSIAMSRIGLKRRRELFRATLLAIGAAFALCALAASARAAGRVLIVPSDDGYGFEECLGQKSACGEMVANAWCEANGLKPSKAFGRADELKAGAAQAQAAPGAYYVACGEAEKTF